MGYSESLDVVARLHVDAAFRAAFLKDPHAALAGVALTPDERERLAALDRAEVIRLGRMADYHRMARIREQLAWMDPGLRPDLRPLLDRYMAERPPQLLNREEAIELCLFLESSPPATPPYLAELARCERLRIALAWGLEPLAGSARVEPFQYPVLQILGALGRPGWPEVLPAPTRVELKKVPGIPAVLVSAVPG